MNYYRFQLQKINTYRFSCDLLLCQVDSVLEKCQSILENYRFVEDKSSPMKTVTSGILEQNVSLENI
jgi:hypothetical protein